MSGETKETKEGKTYGTKSAKLDLIEDICKTLKDKGHNVKYLPTPIRGVKCDTDPWSICVVNEETGDIISVCIIINPSLDSHIDYSAAKKTAAFKPTLGKDR